ncbi:MAG TPA: hypothetical protein VD996_02510 [Chitinophagaceae bacterium]|nr:hypothetical protein [Chitinophagaceae bacterium]
MITPPGYSYALTKEEMESLWPDLKEGENFHFTSLKKRGYKCVWYALMLDRGDIDMLWFRDFYNLDPATLDHSAKGYAKCFQQYFGFEECLSKEYEEGFIKIVLYEDKNQDFKHVARVLPNGYFTSKMGNYEDIQHSLEAVCGNEYGYPVLYMKKSVNVEIQNRFLEAFKVQEPSS